MTENLISNKEPMNLEDNRKTEDQIAGFKESELPDDLSSPNNELNKKRRKHGIISIIGLLIQKVEFGILSNIVYLSVYYVAYLSYKDDTIKMENAISLSSILNFSQFCTNWLGGVLKEFINLRIIIIIGGSCFIFGSIGIIFFRTLLGYKFMMVMFGLGMGMQEMVNYTNASAFIPEKLGFINGLANVAWTLACSFFNYIGAYIVNPEGVDVILYEDNGISDGLIRYTIISIILYGSFTTATAFLTIHFKEKNYLSNDIYEKENKKENKENKIDNKQVDNEHEENNNNDNNNLLILDTKDENKNEKKIQFKAYLRCLRFYTCFFMCTFKNIHCNLVTSSFNVFAIHYKTVSVNTQKYIASASYIANLIITAILSLFIDKFKYRTIVIPSNILCLIHALTFQFIIKNEILFIIYFFLAGLFSSIENLATYPHILRVFCIEYGAIIIGIYCIGTGLGNIAMNSFVDYILSRYDEDQTEQYDYAVKLIFYMTSCFIFISINLMSLENENSVLS